MRVNQIFDNHHYSEEKKVRVASIEFTEYAIIWWDQLNRVGERPNTWEAMKHAMRERFMPAYYTRTLHTKLRRLTQGAKTVSEYYQEMQVLMIRTSVRESAEATMTRFFEGLNEDVRDRVDLMQYNTVQELLHQAERAEQWVKGTQARSGRTTHSTWRHATSHDGDVGSTSKPVASTTPVRSTFKEASKPISAAGKEVSHADSSAFSTARTSNIECFKCKGRGHMKKDCPNMKTVLLTHDGYATESDNDESEPSDESEKLEPLICYPAQGVSLMAQMVRPDNTVIVRKGQRHHIFQTDCKIKEKVCKLIIDNGSSSNMIGKDVVESLSLSTWRHPKPYYIQWLNNVGKVKITHKVRVPLTIDGYVDQVDVGHILLGHPWQFYLNATHQGRSNRYTFMHKGEFHALLSKTDEEIKSDLVVVSKKKAVNTILKPRTVLLQEGEDDEALGASTTVVNIPKLQVCAKPQVEPIMHQWRKKQEEGSAKNKEREVG